LLAVIYMYFGILNMYWHPIQYHIDTEAGFGVSVVHYP